MSSVKKKITCYINLQVPAGKANPAPPIGTALGPKGVNIMEFCKAFNAKTQKMEAGTPIPVVITVYHDRSFTFIMKKPPVTFYLKKAAGIDKGNKATGRDPHVGKIKMSQIRTIAEDKMCDMNADDVEKAMSMIAGSARSMGLEVVEG